MPGETCAFSQCRYYPCTSKDNHGGRHVAIGSHLVRYLGFTMIQGRFGVANSGRSSYHSFLAFKFEQFLYFVRVLPVRQHAEAYQDPMIGDTSRDPPRNDQDTTSTPQTPKKLSYPKRVRIQ